MNCFLSHHIQWIATATFSLLCCSCHNAFVITQLGIQGLIKSRMLLRQLYNARCHGALVCWENRLCRWRQLKATHAGTLLVVPHTAHWLTNFMWVGHLVNMPENTIFNVTYPLLRCTGKQSSTEGAPLRIVFLSHRDILNFYAQKTRNALKFTLTLL
jgi:hypothetical protein